MRGFPYTHSWPLVYPGLPSSPVSSSHQTLTLLFAVYLLREELGNFFKNPHNHYNSVGNTFGLGVFTFKSIYIKKKQNLVLNNTYKTKCGFSGGASGKEPSCKCRRPKRRSLSIPGLGRSPEEGNSSPPQYSCLENPMDRGAWWAIVHGVAKSQTWLSDWPTNQQHKMHLRNFFYLYKYFIVSRWNTEIYILLWRQLVYSSFEIKYTRSLRHKGQVGNLKCCHLIYLQELWGSQVDLTLSQVRHCMTRLSILPKSKPLILGLLTDANISFR